jgi:hypothetical protein
MKKKIISILFCFLIVFTIPIASGISADLENLIPKLEIEDNPTSVFGVAFIAGFVLNPTTTLLGRVNANAVVLVYYDRGIIKNDAGLLTGLKKISFKETSLLSMNEQDSNGLARVFGLCSGFRIGY